jgi:hypothetical protein
MLKPISLLVDTIVISGGILTFSISAPSSQAMIIATPIWQSTITKTPWIRSRRTIYSSLVRDTATVPFLKVTVKENIVGKKYGMVSRRINEYSPDDRLSPRRSLFSYSYPLSDRSPLNIPSRGRDDPRLLRNSSQDGSTGLSLDADRSAISPIVLDSAGGLIYRPIHKFTSQAV